MRRRRSHGAAIFAKDAAMCAKVAVMCSKDAARIAVALSSATHRTRLIVDAITPPFIYVSLVLVEGCSCVTDLTRERARAKIPSLASVLFYHSLAGFCSILRHVCLSRSRALCDRQISEVHDLL